ncbi:MAG: ABC transporter substrate-binding protein [Rhodospirillales bacterium]|nr:ABC transporter substrate-binding protein [Rhodospirillales bacterium]
MNHKSDQPTRPAPANPARRRLLGAAAGLAAGGLGAAVFAPHLARAALPSIRIGYNGSLTAGGVTCVALHFGWFRAAGLDVTGIPFTTFPAQAAALVGGSLDITIPGLNPAVNSLIPHAKIVSLDNLLDDVFVLSRKSGPIRTISDLRGKEVGYVEGTGSQLVLGRALQSAGLSMSDVKAINLQPDGIVSTFLGGRLDAVSIYLPFEAAITERVPVRVLARPSSFKGFAYPMFWMASNALAQKHTDTLVRLLTVKARANDWRKANLKEAAAITARHDRAPNDKPYLQQTTAEDWLSSRQILAAYGSGAFARWLAEGEKLMLQQKMIAAALAPADMLDLSHDKLALGRYLKS